MVLQHLQTEELHTVISVGWRERKKYDIYTCVRVCNITSLNVYSIYPKIHIPMKVLSKVSSTNLPSIRGALQLFKILQSL